MESLSMGLEFVADESTPYAAIEGTAAFGTAGVSYEVEIRANVSTNAYGRTLCPEQVQNLKITIIPEDQPQSATNESGEQEEVLSYQSVLKAKKILSGVDYENVIRWEATMNGPTVVAFRIYKDKNLTKLIKQVPANKRGKYVHRIPYCSPSKNYRYYLVSVSDMGVLSRVVTVKVKGKDNQKPRKKKKQRCPCG